MSKNLDNMTLEELWELFPIILRNYNQDYLEWYSMEKDSILALINGVTNLRISHIGSTAVPNLLSKPIIDILLEVEEIAISQVGNQLAKNGWIIMASQEKPYPSISLNKGYTPQGYEEKVFHLHLRPHGDWDEFYFRDYLIDNDVAARRYEQLKIELLDRYKNDRDAYTREKYDFIINCVRDARAMYGAMES